MIQTKHLIISAFVALSLHLCLLAFWFVKADTSEGAIAEGLDGLTVSVGLAGSFVEAKAQEKAPQEKTETEQGQESETPPETEDVEPLESEPESTSVQEETVVMPVPTVETMTVPAVTTPEKKPAPKIKPEPKPEPKKKPKTEPKPEAPTKPKVSTEKTESVVKKTETTTEKTTTSSTKNTDSKTSQTSSNQATGIGEQRETGGNPAAKQGYLSEVLASIARNKRYPRSARREGVTGIVTVHFTINKNGRVEYSEIRKSAGDERLDQEVLDMLLRASPFPMFPNDLSEESISLTLPIEFSLSQNRKLF